jgi:hypothetical protein
MGFIGSGETKASCLLSSPVLPVSNKGSHRFLISTKLQHFIKQLDCTNGVAVLPFSIDVSAMRSRLSMQANNKPLSSTS